MTEDQAFEVVWYEARAQHDVSLDLYHNTRHPGLSWPGLYPFLEEMKGARIRSPWLSRFDWIFDAHLEDFKDYHGPIRTRCLTKQRASPRTVLVKAGWLKQFVQSILPTVDQRIVLYIGDNDGALSREGVDTTELVSHPMVHKVFCENKDLAIEAITAMPLGMDPPMLLREDWASGLQRIASRVRSELKMPRVFGAWAPKRTIFRSRNDRAEAEAFMVGHSTFCDYHRRLPVGDFWARLGKYRFMLSPWGKTYDTYKTFEALILKTIPIIMAGPYADAYAGLPVVVVQSLDEITPENLERWWQDHGGGFEDMSFVRSDYWWSKIEEAIPGS